MRPSSEPSLRELRKDQFEFRLPKTRALPRVFLLLADQARLSAFDLEPPLPLR
jgi:hypothetical protein